MKLFTAIGTILEATTNTFVTVANAVDNTAHAANNVAVMAKEATQAMVDEQKEEAAQALEALQAKRKAKE